MQADSRKMRGRKEQGYRWLHINDSGPTRSERRAKRAKGRNDVDSPKVQRARCKLVHEIELAGKTKVSSLNVDAVL